MFFGKFIFDSKYVLILALLAGIALPALEGIEKLLMPCLIILLTISLKDINFDKLYKKDYEEILSLFILNYVFVTIFYIIMTKMFISPEFQNALLVYAIMPVAVGTIAFTELFKGNTKIAFLAVFVSYLAGLFLIPLLASFLFGEMVSTMELLSIIFFIIIIPFLISRVLHFLEDYYNKKPEKAYRVLFNFSLAFLFYIILSTNKHFLFSNLRETIDLFILLLIMKIGLVLLLYFMFKKFVKRKNLVVILTFASMKNTSVAVAITIMLFGIEAAAPFAVNALTFPLHLFVLQWLLK